MHRYFALMAAAMVGFFAVVVTLGFRAALDRAMVHYAAAFFLVICLLFVHTLVIFYEFGSGRAIREAIHAYPWSKPWLDRIWRIRVRTLPWALGSMIAAIVAAWIGAAAHTGLTTTFVHRATALGMAGINLFAFFVEYVQLRDNSRMIRELQARLDREAAPPEPVVQEPTA
jgi:hypothetical protein